MDLIEVISRFGSLAVSIAALGWTFVQAGRGARKAEIERVDGRINAVAAEVKADREAGTASRHGVTERLVRIESQLENAPDRDSVHQLALTVSDMRGDLKSMAGEMKQIGATNRRLEDFLLQKPVG